MLMRLLASVLLACAAVLAAGPHGWTHPDDGGGTENGNAPAELRPETRAFVEVAAEPTDPAVGQTVLVRIRVGYDARFFKEHGVPLFRQQMDVPLQVRAPWLRRVAGLERTPLEAPDLLVGTRTFALGDAVVRAKVAESATRGEVHYEVLEITQAYTVKRAGRLSLPMPSIHFAYASTFEEGFLDDRRPLDRQSAKIEGLGEVVIAARAAGMTDDAASGGAVGAFTIHAQVSRSELTPDEVLDLTVTIKGTGNFGDGLAARPSELTPHFDIVGHRMERRPGRQLHHYELAPKRAGEVSVPPLVFAFLDPGPPARERSVATQAIALRVAASTLRGTASDPAPSNATDDTPTPSPAMQPASPGVPGSEVAPMPLPPHTMAGDESAPGSARWWLWALGLLALLAATLALGARRRATLRTSDASAPTQLHSKPSLPRPSRPRPSRPKQATLEERAALKAALDRASTPGALGSALGAFLTAHLRCGPGQVFDTDLTERMRALGYSGEAQNAARELVAAVTEARYGGRTLPEEAPGWVRTLLDATP